MASGVFGREKEVSGSHSVLGVIVIGVLLVGSVCDICVMFRTLYGKIVSKNLTSLLTNTELVVRLVKLISLLGLRVPKEHIRYSSFKKFIMDSARVASHCKTPKYIKVLIFRFSLKHYLIGALVLQKRNRDSVDDVHCCEDTFTPVLERKP